MTAKRFLFSVSPMIVLFGSVWVYGSVLARESEAPIKETKSVAEIDGIANYKKWTRVNPEPQRVDAAISALCAAPTPRVENPHSDKFITVYVNQIGSHAMMKEKSPHFPVGSVIVKEKLTKADSATPELLTVMVKRQAGYDAANGDWEFMVLDGKAEKVQASGRLVNCQGCHLQEKATDYVSRRYLPLDVREKLK